MRILTLTTTLVLLPTVTFCTRFNNFDYSSGVVDQEPIVYPMSSTGSLSSVTGHANGHESTGNRPPGWPGALPLDVDGYPVAPAGLELQQVHIYVRHGALFSFPGDIHR